MEDMVSRFSLILASLRLHYKEYLVSRFSSNTCFPKVTLYGRYGVQVFSNTCFLKVTL